MTKGRDNTIVADIAHWIIRKFLSSRTKALIPQKIYNLLYKHAVIPLIGSFSYSEYLNHQREHSAWSRQVEKSRLGLETACKEMSQWLTHDKHFLDLGCGDGYMLDLVKPHVGLAVGIDYHFGKLHKSLAHGNIGVLSDIHKLPFGNAVFDVIHISHVLEHVIYPDQALQEIQRILKPEGHLLIVVPSGGPTTIKHPNTFKHKIDIHRQIGKYFAISRIWEANTREAEFWIIANKVVTAVSHIRT